MFEIFELIYLLVQAVWGLIQAVTYAIVGVFKSVMYVIDSILGGGRRFAGRRDRAERKLAQAEAKEAGFDAKRGGWRRPRGPYTHLRRGAVYVPRLTLKRSVPLGRVIQLEYQVRNGSDKGRATWSCAFLPTLFDAPYTIIQPRYRAIEPQTHGYAHEVDFTTIDLNDSDRGPSDFNEQWVVHSTDESFARWLVDGPVQERLMDPEIPASRLTIELTGTEVLIAVPERSVRTLVDYFWWAIDLRDLLVRPRDAPPAPVPALEQTADETVEQTDAAAPTAPVDSEISS